MSSQSNQSSGILLTNSLMLFSVNFDVNSSCASSSFVAFGSKTWSLISAKGVVAGGALRQSFRKLKLKAIPANLPDEIVVDVTPLKIGNKLYVGDIKADGFTFMHKIKVLVNLR